MKKLSPYVKSVKQAYKNKMLLIDDVLEMYKDNYLSKKELKEVLDGRIR